MAIVAASTDTHFLLNGNKMPRVYSVFPSGAQDAILEDADGSGVIHIPSGSTVGGSVPASQSALVDALALLVSGSAGGGGSGASASAIATAINTLPARLGTINVPINTAATGGFSGTYTPPAAAQVVTVQLQGGGSWHVSTDSPVASATVGQSRSAGDDLLLASRGQYTFHCSAAGGVVYGEAA